MAITDKDTIYIDIDDEITGIIDKVRSSKGKVVALVLPKRATVFQSIVNMKLLNRASNDAKKNLVLITTETGLMPLAGAAGLYVASSLNAKPAIPTAPSTPTDIEEAVEDIDADMDEITAENAGDVPVGELATLAGGATATAPKTDDLETVELDNGEPEDDIPLAAGAAAPLVKKDKKLAVPNFERFRLLIILGSLGLVLLVAGLIFALNVMPKAVIAIDTDATSVSIDENVKLSTEAKSMNVASGTLPAKLAKQSKTYSQQVPATGEKNNGNKASGEITMTACVTSATSVPAGTGVSSGGKTYITQDDADLTSPSGFCSGGGAKVSATVDILAQSGGANYNVASGTSFTVSGRSEISATGSANGGTDNIVKVVSESDIAAAKGKINTNDPTVKQTLENDLKDDKYYPITATFVASEPNSTTSSNAGDAASSVTVTATVSYSMFGVQRADLKKLIESSVKEQIDTSKQSLLNDGVDEAVFNVSSQSDKEAELSMHTEVAAGPDLDIETIKQDAAGKKPGEVKSSLETNPDVTGVEVKLSPFWVSSVPKKTGKITVTIEKPKPAPKTNDAE